MRLTTFSVFMVLLNSFWVGGLVASDDQFLVSKEFVRHSTCSKPVEDEEILHNEDFAWNSELEEILDRANNIYHNGKRLENRAYVNADKNVVIEMRLITGEKKEVRLTENLIKSVRAHIENALKRRYVDAIIFSDMGHSHFFIPQKFYDEVLSPIPISENHRRYEKMLAHEEIKILYHTAEQLKMHENSELAEDRHVQWRFFTRNLVGDNRAQGHLELLHNETHSHNTASANSYDSGYRYWGAGFYVSASKDGCFPYVHEGETYYFDLNLSGMRPRNYHSPF